MLDAKRSASMKEEVESRLIRASNLQRKVEVEDRET